ncbi:MAG TPA: phosphoribosyltransferase [Flavobacteriales bacterium]|nr:phosphoribosyltransferase [Flavobacteriales bacterium]
MKIEKEATQILDNHQSNQKIERIAWQILENNSEEKSIAIAGISSRGYELAKIIKKKLEKISDIKVNLVEICVNKKQPFSEEVTIDCEVKNLKNKVVIVVDDVLNSGRTMLFALTPFMKFDIKRLSIAVLLNRSYRNYPVEAKYVGMSLSTTLQEHIEVKFSKNGKISAYLM